MSGNRDTLSDDVTPRQRPSEYATAVAGAIAGLLVWAFDIDSPQVTANLIVVIAFIPAGVTWLVHTLRRNGHNVGPDA